MATLPFHCFVGRGRRGGAGEVASDPPKFCQEEEKKSVFFGIFHFENFEECSISFEISLFTLSHASITVVPNRCAAEH